MAAFLIQGKNLSELKSKIFPLERDLQILVDDNLEKIFGLEFIRTQFGGQGLSIDTIAYDPETKSPVLIEYKKDTYQSVVDQGMAYLNWLLSHKGDYQVALNEKLGQRQIDWSQPRVIFIAKSFNVHQIYASGFKNAPFELYRYDWCGDVFILEPVETPKSDVSITSILKTKEARQVAKEVKTYSVEEYLARASEPTRALIEKIRKIILAFDERIQEKALSQYIGYRIRYYNFCTISSYQKSFRLFVRVNKITDPKNIFKRAARNWVGGKTPVWYADIRTDQNLDYILSIVKHSYQSAPDL